MLLPWFGLYPFQCLNCYRTRSYAARFGPNEAKKRGHSADLPSSESEGS